jgi:hypothetical protein
VRSLLQTVTSMRLTLEAHVNQLPSKCPGINFAEAALFVTITSLLAAFTFSKKRDAHGQEIAPQIEDEGNALVL